MVTIQRLAKEGKLVCVYSGNRLRINPLASVEKLNSYTESKPLDKKEPKEEQMAESPIYLTSLSKPTKHRGKLPDKLRNKSEVLK